MMAILRICIAGKYIVRRTSDTSGARAASGDGHGASVPAGPRGTRDAASPRSVLSRGGAYGAARRTDEPRLPPRPRLRPRLHAWGRGVRRVRLQRTRGV